MPVMNWLCSKIQIERGVISRRKNVDAMIVRSDIVDKDVIASASQLKIVVRAGAGYDNIDLAAASAKM